jgi:hypothetical protein
MADSDIIPFGAAIAGDVLSALSIPGGNALSSIVTSALAKKRREAAEILIREASAGLHGPIKFEDHDIDPLIDIILRFSKAVEEGAARENLILLAQIIAGLKKRRALEADKFRKWRARSSNISLETNCSSSDLHIACKNQALRISTRT